MADVRLYVHAVWGVKNRQPTLDETKRKELFDHILENVKEKNIEVLAINGHTDHVHCLLRMKATQCMADMMQLIKGESSNWANKISLFEEQLTWARSYYARSVDEKNLHIVKRYINNQHKHQNGEIKDYLDKLSKDQQPEEPDKE